MHVHAAVTGDPDCSWLPAVPDLSESVLRDWQVDSLTVWLVVTVGP
jgi:hypothetical protein